MTIPILKSPLLENIPGLLHGFTTREGGVSNEPFHSLNLGLRTGDDEDRVEENYQRLAKEFQTDRDQWVGVQQEHGNTVYVVQNRVLPEEVSQISADAMITTLRSVILTVRVADCVPILLYDPDHKALGVVHAGWRGTLAKVLPTAILAMKENFKTNPSKLIVSMGPAIGKCCLEVSHGISSLFEQQCDLQPSEVAQKNGKPYLDLCDINNRLAKGEGVPPTSIYSANFCTQCNADQLYSYRFHGKHSGRFIGFIGWKNA